MGEAMRAARVDDTIGHTYKKLAVIFGSSAGIAAGIAITYFTRGKTASVTRLIGRAVGEGAGLMGIGSWLATMVSDAIGPKGSGRILDGASRTWTEDERSARITDPCECGDPPGTQLILALAPIFGGPVGAIAGVFGAIDAIGDLVQGEAPGTHTDSKIKQGSQTVFIEDRNASRVGDKTTCEGTIMTAAERTWIGGVAVTLAGHESGAEEGSTVAGTVRIIGHVSSVVGQLMSLTDSEGHPGKQLIGVAKFGLRYIGETNPDAKWYTDRAQIALDVVSNGIDVRRGKFSPRGAITSSVGAARTLTTPQPTTGPTVRYPE